MDRKKPRPLKSDVIGLIMTAQSQTLLSKKFDEPKKSGTSHFFSKILGWLGAVLTLFFAILILSEWFQIGVIADPKEIGEYYFGSETMISHGGWKYQSASVYAWTCFIEGLVYICVTALLVHSTLRNKYRRIYFVYAIWLILVVYNWYGIIF